MYFNQLLENEKPLYIDEYIQSSTFNVAMETLDLNSKLTKNHIDSLNAEIVTEGVLSSIWNAIKSFLKAIWNVIKSVFNTIFRWLGFKKEEMKKQEKIMNKPVSKISKSEVSKTYQSKNVSYPNTNTMKMNSQVQSIPKTLDEINKATTNTDRNIQKIKTINNQNADKAINTLTTMADLAVKAEKNTREIKELQDKLARLKAKNMSQAIQQQEEKKQEEKKKEQLKVEDIPITNRFIWIDPINAGSNLNQWETGIKSLTHILGNFLNNVNVDKETGILTNKTNNKIYNEIISTLSDNITVDNTYNDQEYIKLVDKVLDLDSSEFNGEKMLIYPLRLNEDVSVKRIDAILKILGSKKMFFETSDKSLDEYWGIYTVKTERKYRKKFLDAVDKYVNKSLLIELETAYKSIDKMIDEAEKNEKYDENKAGHNIAIKISRFLSIGFRVLYFNQLLLFKAISQISYWSELQESKSIEKYLLENN